MFFIYIESIYDFNRALNLVWVAINAVSTYLPPK